jgi:hypothetical protein
MSSCRRNCRRGPLLFLFQSTTSFVWVLCNLSSVSPASRDLNLNHKFGYEGVTEADRAQTNGPLNFLPDNESNE